MAVRPHRPLLSASCSLPAGRRPFVPAAPAVYYLECPHPLPDALRPGLMAFALALCRGAPTQYTSISFATIGSAVASMTAWTRLVGP